MLGIFLVAISSLFFGFSNAYWKSALGTRPFLPILFVRGLYTFLFFFFIGVWDSQSSLFQRWLGESPQATVTQWALSFALCLFSVFGLYFFVKSIQKSTVSLVIPVSSINVFGLATSTFILHESWTYNFTFALVLVFMGILLLYISEWKDAYSKGKSFGITEALYASFFWGVSYALFRYPIEWLGVIRFTCLLEFCLCLMVGLMLFRGKNPIDSLPHRSILVLALCVILGSVFLHISYQYASMTQIVFAGKFQLIFSLLVSQILYREKLNLFQCLGILLLITSIYLIY